MEPLLLRNVFDASLRDRLLNDCDWIIRNKRFSQDDDSYGRVISGDPRLMSYAERLLPTAHQVFGRDDLLPSYALWARYAQPQASLSPHKDVNACTYTIDYCVRQHESWELFVEGQGYVLQANDALAFMGEDQEHWRAPWQAGNMVEMIFFHYVPPDHWYFE